MANWSVEAENLTRVFGDFTAVDHISFRVREGQIFGFLGPNGAGKSTTIRMLAGILPPTSGTGRVAGFDMRTQRQNIKQAIGYMSQKFSLYEDLTVRENLGFFGGVYGATDLDWAVGVCRLESVVNTVCASLSAGLRQRAALACAVVHRPRIVFLDEPTAGLDPVASAALRDDLASLAVGQGVTVFLTTHNLVEAERLCALVGVIRRGRLVAMGPPGSLLQENSAIVRISGSGLDEPTAQGALSLPGVIAAALDRGELVVRLAPGATSAALVAMLVQRGVGVEEVRRERRTLEEAFLELVGEDSAGARSPSGGAMPGDGRAG